MNYKGRYIEDDYTVVIVFGNDLVEVNLRIPNRTKEEAYVYLKDDIIPTMHTEVILV